MVNEENEPQGPNYETQEEKETREEKPEVAEDQRVPSDPDNLRPADVPPEPLTRREYSETEAPQGDEGDEEGADQ